MKLKHFGTDGIRGIVGVGITPEAVVKVAQATAAFIIARSIATKQTRPSVIVGCDTRRSCDYIINILSGVLAGYGINIVNVGVVPSAALSFLTHKLKGDLGIMVSASHNSFQYNGLKFFTQTGEKLGAEATAQLDALITKNFSNTVRAMHCYPSAKADETGVIRCQPKAVYMWEKFIIKSFKPLFNHSPKQCRPLIVHIDCAFGSGGEVAARVLGKLGFSVQLHSANHDGININCNSGAIYPLYMRDAIKKAKESEENAALCWIKGYAQQGARSVGFSFDGDADRCVFTNSDGETVHGDVLLYGLAKFLQQRGELNGNTLVATVMFNLGAEKALERVGIKLLRTPVGDSHVYEAVKEQCLTLGGETSGHIIFPNIWCCGDGLVTALVVLLAIQNKQFEIRNDCEIFPQATRNISVTAERKAAIVKDKQLKAHIKSLQSANPEYRIIVRPSGTEDLIRVAVEGKDAVNCEWLTDLICDVID